jgi:ketosteroid isomerase-like protein
VGEADKIDLDELRRIYDALGKRDWDRAQALQHPDMVWHDPPEVPDAGVHVGRDAIRRYWEDELFDAWEHWELDLKELIPSGDRILGISRLRARARHTGIDQDIDLFQVFTFKDGLAIEQRAFLNREQAFEFAGIDPESS